MGLMANSVVHFEIPADDVERARAFYQGAFGWTIEAYPGMDYHGVTTAAVDEKTRMPLEPGAINGGMMQRSAEISAPVLTIGVDDIDASLEAVERLGGKTLMGRQAVADMGFTGYFTDSEGNVVGLWQSARQA
jgi:predicted enzyme related to lactoylglutathione lyase